MPERIPELDRLASAAQEVPVLSASEIRRRGSRRRLTRHVAVGVGACAFALAAGFGTVQAFAPSTPDWANPSPVPTVSAPEATPTAAPSGPSVLTGLAAPTWENMVTPDLLFTQGEVPGVVKDDSEGPPAAGSTACASPEVGDPTTVLTRTMGLEGERWPALYHATIYGYPDVARAEAAFDQLKAENLTCRQRLSEQGWTAPSTQDLTDDVVFTPPVGAEDAQVAYTLSMGGPDAASEMGLFVETTLIRTGARVLVLTQQFEGMDYNCSVVADPDIAQCAAPAALDAIAERLSR